MFGLTNKNTTTLKPFSQVFTCVASAADQPGCPGEKLSLSPSSLDTCDQVRIFAGSLPGNSLDKPWEIARLKSLHERELAKNRVIAGLKAAGRLDEAGKISDCRIEYKIGQCDDCGEVVAYPLSCSERLCPDCSRARAERLIEEHHDILAQIRAPKMLTLTFKSVKHINREYLRFMRKCFSRLLRSKVMGSCWGGIYSFEFTYHKTTGWHPHIHAVIGSGFIAQDELSNTWERISGAKIVDIRAIDRDVKKWDGIREVVKYSTKLVDFIDNPDLLEEYLQATERVKLVQGFGSLYRVACRKHGDIDTHTCPICGGQRINFGNGWGFNVSRYDERLRMVKNGWIFLEPGGVKNDL